MNIQYYVKHVFGKPTMYIKDREQAAVVAVLIGRKILTQEAMEALKYFGVTFEQVLPPL